MPETITDTPPTTARFRVRERIGNGLARVAKVFGTSVPAEIAAAEVAAGMDAGTPFSPGAPLSPYDGYSRTPRTQNFVPQRNVAARPRSDARVSFDTLRGLVDAYDIASMAIWHRIDSLRSLNWSLVAADGHTGDIKDAVEIGTAILRKPDGQTPFSAWLAEYAYDILAYDAGCLWRMRNRAGQCVGLRVVDGTLIAPLLDDWGNAPASPAPAYVQYINGLPWNWLTTNDLIYRPFRKVTNSPYGRAPLESVILNANTDLRFQAYFLQTFTAGNIPAAFASAPEGWTPEQIEQFQEQWDAFLLGDQEFKSQVRWIPPGSKIAWSNEKDFSDAFSLHLMRKTLASFHVVPADMGFTENVNKSSGETQRDVQHRIGDVPLASHISDVITTWLQDDLHLPLRHEFDFGEEQDDRLATAQADDIYAKMGAISVSTIREMRYGLSEPDGKSVPRFIFSERGGPIPLLALDAVAGPIDPESGAPMPDAPLPHDVFQPVEGVEANPPTPRPPLAVDLYGPQALPVAAPQSVPALPPGTVEKDGPTAGITTATGITSYDLVGHSRDDDDDREPEDEDLAKARDTELTAYRRYLKGRRRAGRWSDFTFTTLDPITAHRLNDNGRLAVRKSAGQIAVAGLAVVAADTGRVLMIQRALDPDDPAAGTWECPGGHLEAGETPLAAAQREWAEEAGQPVPSGEQTGEWTAGGGVYRGIVWTVPSEDCVPVDGDRDQITNPDDPDGDQIEAIAWWDPAHLADNPAVRPELVASLTDVFAALGSGVAKAALPDPKAGSPQDGEPPPVQQWPGWQLDLDAAAYWAPLIASGLLGAVSVHSLVRAFLREHSHAEAEAPTDAAADAAAQALAPTAVDWVQRERDVIEGALARALEGVWSDGYLIGESSAAAVIHAIEADRPLESAVADTGDWVVGDTEAAKLLLGERGQGDGLRTLLDREQIRIKSIADSRLDELGRHLAAGAARGDSADTIAVDITALLSNPSRAQMIATTELARAVSAGTVDSYQKRGWTHATWSTAYDDRVCSACDANEAEGAHELGVPFASGAVYPPQHPMCFPAGVLVSGPSAVAAASRRYEGDLVTVVFADGQEVPVTPNHPVLTPDGWVAAGDLREGSQVLRAREPDRVTNLVCPDDRQAVARIEDVAASLREAGPVATEFMPLSAEDFHGDGAGDDHVEVVSAARHAQLDLQAEAAQEVREGGLVSTERAPCLGQRDLRPLLRALDSPGHEAVGRFGQRGALFGRGPLPPEDHGVRSVPAVDPRFTQHPVNGVPVDLVLGRKRLNRFPVEEFLDKRDRRNVPAPIFGDPHRTQFVVEGAVADADGGRTLANRLAAFVETDRVIDLRRVKWSGHVYNLETVAGWYFANGIIAHNCRCALLPSLSSEV